MIDGEDWKRKQEEEEWNSPENICLDEYASILEVFRGQVLRPLAKGSPVDKHAVAMTKADLEWKLKHDANLKKVPLKIQNAYESLKQLAVALKTATDEELLLRSHRDVFDGLLDLTVDCDNNGYRISSMHKGRNPCRASQYTLNSALRKAEETLRSSKVF